MQAVRIHGYGDPSVLRVEDVPEPEPGPHDLRIAVHATSVNPVDCKIRSGGQRAVVWLRMPWTLGMDVSGTVEQVGSAVRGFEVGDEVFGSPSHRRMGCYAEQVVVRDKELAPKPKRIDHAEAASLPLVALTAWDALVSACKVRDGQRVLVQAGSGGVGSIAIQLAKHLGAEVLTTCSARNAELVRELGADEVIDYRERDFEEVARGCDAILESIGGEHLDRAIRTVRRGGHVAAITPNLPRYTERHGPWLGLAAFVMRLLGLMTRGRLVHGARLHMVTRRPNAENLRRIAELVDEGAIRPVVDRTMPLSEAAEAHRYVETGRARGKVVLTPGG